MTGRDSSPTPDRYPLASQQQDPDHVIRSSKHTFSSALRIKGELRLDALKGALDDVVERHGALRTRINYGETDEGEGYQEVLPPLPVPFTVHDIPVVPGRSRDEIAVDVHLGLCDELIDFSVTPSLRAALYRFDDHDAVLTLITHHLFGDNWSSGVLRRDLAACYNARVSGTPHALPTPFQYHEYASRQRGFLRSEKADTVRRYWTDTLSDTGMYAMPADRPSGPDGLKSPSAVWDFLIDPDDSAKIRAGAGLNRCTAYHVFLAAAVVLAEKIRGSSDVTLLTVNNGRNSKDFQDSVGFFSSMVPLRLEFGTCKTFREIMLLARKSSMDAQRNLMTLEDIIPLVPDLMKPFGDPQSMPFAFNYARPPMASADIQFADSVEPVILPDEAPAMYHRGACMWGLTMLPAGEFRCVVEYEPDMVDADTVDRWGSDFVNLVLAIANTPDRPWRDR
ncbi:hypothetical protein KDL01_20705 [Actinospica durhamensis]|uniref:Condensation domain-containing protein n=1 Tax=Actinospica durhamensis TaxID=1508375 RepID=A0A941IQ07_9ACTN|nr:condensation domain-containing protein [Actinospica durhamensis]MBR7835709.1 hypothetical protein [Actinospica durhamensis]